MPFSAAASDLAENAIGRWESPAVDGRQRNPSTLHHLLIAGTSGQSTVIADPLYGLWTVTVQVLVPDSSDMLESPMPRMVGIAESLSYPHHRNQRACPRTFNDSLHSSDTRKPATKKDSALGPIVARLFG